MGSQEWTPRLKLILTIPVVGKFSYLRSYFLLVSWKTFMQETLCLDKYTIY